MNMSTPPTPPKSRRCAGAPGGNTRASDPPQSQAPKPRSDLNTVHKQMLTNRSRTVHEPFTNRPRANNLIITHMRSRTVHEQPFTNKALFLLDTVEVTPSPKPTAPKRKYSTVQYSTVQYSTVQCSAVQCSAMQCNAVQCSAMQCSAVQCSVVQCSIQCSVLQCSIQCSVV